jgi:ComF family protein
MRDVVRRACAEALALAFPVDCCVCGAWGSDVCRDCAASIETRVRSRRLEGGLEVWSGLDYADAVAPAIRALKEEGRTGIARTLAPALRAAVDRASAGAEAVLFVPVPTSRAAMRRRGFRPVELLLRRAGERPTRLLRYTREVADQRGLDRSERERNIGAAFVVRSFTDRPVVVVDDVVTTGATLRAAVRALDDAGAYVLGAATLASVPRTLRG